MFKLLRQLISPASALRDDDCLPDQMLPAHTQIHAEHELSIWSPGADLELYFLKQLLPNDTSLNDAEKTILTALERLCQSEWQGSKLIPRVPTVVPQLLKSLRDENVSDSTLAQYLAKDVLLVAELIAEVNSAYYSPPNKITSLDQAVRMLGINGLRMLVARVAFRPLIQLQSGSLANAAAPYIWQQSDWCASAAHAIAQRRGEDSFAAFLAGLTQSIGLMIALRTVDQSLIAHGLPDSLNFRLRFLQTATLLSARMAKYWQFPPAVCSALVAQLPIFDNSSYHPHNLALCVRQAIGLGKLRLLVAQKNLSRAEAEELFGHDEVALDCFQLLFDIPD